MSTCVQTPSICVPLCSQQLCGPIAQIWGKKWRFKILAKTAKNAKGFVKGSFWSSLVMCLKLIFSNLFQVHGPHRIQKMYHNPSFCSAYFLLNYVYILNFK